MIDFLLPSALRRQLTGEHCCYSCSCCSLEQFGFASNSSNESKLKSIDNFGRQLFVQTFLPFLPALEIWNAKVACLT